MAEANLEPDDIRSDPVLHRMVQDRLQEIMAEERQRLNEVATQPNAPPISVIVQETKRRMRKERLSIIQEYQARNG